MARDRDDRPPRTDPESSPGPGPPGGLARLLAARLADDERRGLAAEGDREADPRRWGRWADNFTHTPAGPDADGG